MYEFIQWPVSWFDFVLRASEYSSFRVPSDRIVAAFAVLVTFLAFVFAVGDEFVVLVALVAYPWVFAPEIFVSRAVS